MSQTPGPELSRYQRLIWSPKGPRPSGRLVLQVLVRFMLAGQDGRIFPSEDTIAADTGLSVRQVRRLIPDLEAGGWIARKSFGAKGQGWRRTEYKLHWPRGFDPAKDQWLVEVKRRKDEGRAQFREENGWPSEEEEEEPEPPPPPDPPPAAIDLRGIDRQAWEEWLAYRQSTGELPTDQSQVRMAAMLRPYPAEEQRAMVQWSNDNGWRAPPNLKDWSFARWRQEHSPPEVHEGQLLDFQAARERRNSQPAQSWLGDEAPPPPPPLDPEPPLPGIEPAVWRRLVSHWQATGAYVTRQQAEMVAQRLRQQSSQIAWVDQVIARNLPLPLVSQT